MEDFQVSSADEGRVAHVDVHLSFGGVSSDNDSVLSYHVLKLSRLQPGNGSNGCV